MARFSRYFRWKRPQIDNLSLRLLALFLAIVLWFLASDRPTTSIGLDQRTVNVEPRVEGLGPRLEVTQPPESVSLTLQGPRLLLPFQADDVEAYVDATGREGGRHRLPVQVRTPTNIIVKAINPSEVEIVLEQQVEKRLPVRASILGGEGGALVRVGEVRPAEMSVYGVESRVARTAFVLAVVDLSSGSGKARAVPVDAEGIPVPGVVTEQEWVDVVVWIDEEAAPPGGA